MCIWIIWVPCQYSDSVGLCRSPRYFSFVTNAEVMRKMLRQHLGRVATGSVALISNRTFCIDGKIPYLCHPYQQPLNTCSYRSPEMWFMEMKYWTLIWMNAHLNSFSLYWCMLEDYCVCIIYWLSPVSTKVVSRLTSCPCFSLNFWNRAIP